jgi:hypothetical protein
MANKQLCCWDLKVLYCIIKGKNEVETFSGEDTRLVFVKEYEFARREIKTLYINLEQYK